MAQNAPPAVVIPMAGLIEDPLNDLVFIPLNHPLAVQFGPFLAPPAVPAQGGPAMRSGKLSYFSLVGLCSVFCSSEQWISSTSCNNGLQA